jgi:uncharacterized protein (DUF305 family)
MNRSSPCIKTGSILLVALVFGWTNAQSAAPASDDMKKVMDSGMQSMQAMPKTGDTDKDFATMMKMHHQQALDMAKVELEHGKSPELKAMASKMIRDQTKEIEQLEKWLQKHK